MAFIPTLWCPGVFFVGILMIVSLTSSWEISANTKLLSPSITSTFLDHIRSEVIISCQSLGFYRGIFTKRYEKMIEFVGDVVTISWIRQYRTSSRVQAVSVCLPDWGLIVSRFADFIPNQLAFWWLDRRFYLATQNPEGFPFTRFFKVWLASSWASSRCCIIFLISGGITFDFLCITLNVLKGACWSRTPRNRSLKHGTWSLCSKRLTVSQGAFETSSKNSLASKFLYKRAVIVTGLSLGSFRFKLKYNELGIDHWYYKNIFHNICLPRKSHAVTYLTSN